MDRFVKTLEGRPKTELLDCIGRLIFCAPEGLAVLGVKGFEDKDLDDVEDEDSERPMY